MERLSGRGQFNHSDLQRWMREAEAAVRWWDMSAYLMFLTLKVEEEGQEPGPVGALQKLEKATNKFSPMGHLGGSVD